MTGATPLSCAVLGRTTSDTATTARFELAGVCYGRETWDASSEPFMSFMTCLYGTQHHSFIFMGSRFIDNGFRFANDAMGETELAGLFTEASADFRCPRPCAARIRKLSFSLPFPALAPICPLLS